MSYDKARIEALERELKRVSILVSFIKEHHPQAYKEAVSTTKIETPTYNDDYKIDTD